MLLQQVKRSWTCTGNIEMLIYTTVILTQSSFTHHIEHVQLPLNRYRKCTESFIQSHVISNNSAHDNDHSNVSWLLVSTSSINIFTASIDWYKYYLLCLNWDHYTCICISIWRPHLSTCDVWTHLTINTRRRRETWLLQSKVVILFRLIHQIFCGRWTQRSNTSGLCDTLLWNMIISYIWWCKD